MPEPPVPTITIANLDFGYIRHMTSVRTWARTVSFWIGSDTMLAAIPALRQARGATEK